MKIDGLDVEIMKLDIQQNYTSVRYGFSSNQIPASQSIRMIGIVSNKDYMKLDSWFNGVLGRNYMASSPVSYKKNIIFNTIQIMGIFPLDYNFNQSGIEVTFSVDYINGDLELFKIQRLRKEKLLKLNSLQ